MEDLDEKIMAELKEKAIERTDEIEITDNTIDEELMDEQPASEPPQPVKKTKKVRSEKQIAAFEKARLKRAENLKIKKQLEAEKKAQKKAEKEEVKAQVKQRLEARDFPQVTHEPPPQVQKHVEGFREQVVNNYYYYGRQPTFIDEEEYEPSPPPKRKKKGRKVKRLPTPVPSSSEEEEEEEYYSDAEEPQSYRELQNYEETERYDEPEPAPETQLKFRFA